MATKGKERDRSEYFRFLELPETANQDDLRAAYKKLALKWHPDKNPSDEAQARFQEISMAYRVLSGQDSQKDYGAGHEYDSEDAEYDSEEDLWMYDLFENMFSGGFYPQRCNCPNCGGETEEWRRAKAQMRRDERRRQRLERREQARKEPKVVQQPPEVMEPPRPSRITNTSATLTWCTPMDHGSEVDSFTMHVRIKRNFGGFGEWLLVYKGGANEYTVEDLAPGHCYQFRIRAHNECGDCPLFSKLCDVKTTGKPPKTKMWKHPPIRSNLHCSEDGKVEAHESPVQVKKKSSKKSKDKFAMAFTQTDDEKRAEADRLRAHKAKLEAEAAAARYAKEQQALKEKEMKEQKKREKEEARKREQEEKERKEKEKKRAAEKREREKAEKEKAKQEAEEKRKREEAERKRAEEIRNQEEAERKRKEQEKEKQKQERQRKVQEQIEKERKRMEENLRRRKETQKVRDAVASLGVSTTDTPAPTLLKQPLFGADVALGESAPVSGAQIVAMAEAQARVKELSEADAARSVAPAAPVPLTTVPVATPSPATPALAPTLTVDATAAPTSQPLTAAQIASAKPSTSVVRKATNGLKAGSKDSRGRTVVDWDKYDHGMIFLCNNQTFAECLDRKLMGLPKNRLNDVKRLRPGTCALFLYNPQRRSVAGVFDASAAGGLMLQPEAWKGAFSYSKKKGMSPFPAQIPFEVAAHTERVLVKVSALTSRGINMRSSSARVLDRSDTQKILQVFLDTLGLVSPSMSESQTLAVKPAPPPRVPAWTSTQPLAVSMAAQQEKEQLVAQRVARTTSVPSQQDSVEDGAYDEEYDAEEDQELGADDLEETMQNGFHSEEMLAADDWGAAPVSTAETAVGISPSLVGASLAGPTAAYSMDATAATTLSGSASAVADSVGPSRAHQHQQHQQTCTFGVSCVQPECMYAHPHGRPVLENLLGTSGLSASQTRSEISAQDLATALSGSSLGDASAADIRGTVGSYVAAEPWSVSTSSSHYNALNGIGPSHTMLDDGSGVPPGFDQRSGGMAAAGHPSDPSEVTSWTTAPIGYSQPTRSLTGPASGQVPQATSLGLGLGMNSTWGWDGATHVPMKSHSAGGGSSAGGYGGVMSEQDENDQSWLTGFNAALIPQAGVNADSTHQHQQQQQQQQQQQHQHHQQQHLHAQEMQSWQPAPHYGNAFGRGAFGNLPAVDTTWSTGASQTAGYGKLGANPAELNGYASFSGTAQK